MKSYYDNHDNPTKTKGFLFIEYATQHPKKIEDAFSKLGLKLTGRHKTCDIDLWSKNNVVFLVNKIKGGYTEEFASKHGDGVCGIGFFVENAKHAFVHCVNKKVRHDEKGDNWNLSSDGESLYSVNGIADTKLYFGDKCLLDYDNLFIRLDNTNTIQNDESAQLLNIDHITHNVFRGNMDKYADFYSYVFNFRQVRYFDIEGNLTGLLSRAMTSPCGNIRIPINESSDDHSQIEEFINLYSGEGVQHIALSTNNIYSLVDNLNNNGIVFMDTPDSYYKTIKSRLPYNTEDINLLKKSKILIDGESSINRSDNKTLLQIFTENMIGPLFFEVIQRKGDEGFGENNFKALFTSIENDQVDRGVIK